VIDDRACAGQVLERVAAMQQMLHATQVVTTRATLQLKWFSTTWHSTQIESHWHTKTVEYLLLSLSAMAAAARYGP
jgi:hypothetical protein